MFSDDFKDNENVLSEFRMILNPWDFFSESLLPSPSPTFYNYFLSTASPVVGSTLNASHTYCFLIPHNYPGGIINPISHMRKQKFMLIKHIGQDLTQGCLAAEPDSNPSQSDFRDFSQCSVLPLSSLLPFSLQFSPVPFLFPFLHAEMKMGLCEVRVESFKTFQFLFFPSLQNISWSWQQKAAVQVGPGGSLLTDIAVQAHCSPALALGGPVCGCCSRCSTNVEWLSVEKGQVFKGERSMKLAR